jgi:hypothetical protein
MTFDFPLWRRWRRRARQRAGRRGLLLALRARAAKRTEGGVIAARIFGTFLGRTPPPNPLPQGEGE